MKEIKDLQEVLETKTETCEETEKMTEIEIEDLAIDGICGVY